MPICKANRALVLAAIVERPGSTNDDLAELLNVTHGNIEIATRALRDMGVVRGQTERGGRWLHFYFEPRFGAAPEVREAEPTRAQTKAQPNAGLRILLALPRATEPVPVAWLSEEADVPENYAANLLRRYVARGLVKKTVQKRIVGRRLVGVNFFEVAKRL